MLYEQSWNFLKIAFLVERFLPYRGGIPMRVYKIAKGLTQRGHEITVHTASHPRAPSTDRIDGIKVRRYDFIGIGQSALNRLFRAPHGPVMPQLFKLPLAREIQDIDIVQSFMFMSYVTLSAALLKLVKKKIFVLAPYCPPDYRGVPGFSTHWSFVLYRLTVGMAILRYADFHLTETNRETKNLIKGFGVRPDRIQAIADGIESSKYSKLPDPIDFKKEYHIDPDSKVILFVGFPQERKGLPHILLSMNKVLKKVKDARLIIVGPKPKQAHAALEDFGSPAVREHTVVTGYLSERSLLSAYSAADVFALPSLLEGFGRVFIEAAAAGVPVVSTSTGVIPDIIVPGKNGLIVKYGDVDQISDAITMVLMNGDFKTEAEKRRSLILKNYDHKKEVEQHEKVYLRLLAGQNKLNV